MSSAATHRRGEHVRQAVLAAAAGELAAHGFDGATVAGVAKRSGVHETTVYRRWVTRENLFVAALLERSADAIPVPDTGSTRSDLLALVREVVGYAGSPAGMALLRAALLPVDDAYADARKDFWAHRLDALSPVVQRGIERGDLRADTDARLLLEILVAPIHGRLLLTGEPVDDSLAERLVELALNGAAASPGQL
ncbi:MAG: TetR/AcrR family transcriptional regulator C-terminal ligand-binding domain-containing protein [Mycobacterium sp.]